MSEYYTVSGWPATNAAIASAPARSEMNLISAGFDKMPTLSGNANKPVFVNGSANGLESVTASVARANLGVEIGVDVQAEDAGLTSIAGLTTTANRMIYTTASDTYAVTSLTSFARSLLDDSNSGAARDTLGAVGTTHSGTVTITGQLDIDDISLNGSSVTTSSTATWYTSNGYFNISDSSAAGSSAVPQITLLDSAFTSLASLGITSSSNNDLELKSSRASSNVVLTPGSGGTAKVGANEILTAGNLSSYNLDSSSSPQFTGVNIGHASDTTITRLAAGEIAVEGNRIGHIAYDSDLTLDSTFTGGSVRVTATRVSAGYWVKLSGLGSHASAISAASTALIPSAYRPSTTVSQITNIDSSGLMTRVFASGAIGMVHFAEDFTATSVTASSLRMFAEWFVAD